MKKRFALYRAFNRHGELLYVGKSIRPFRRMSEHMRRDAEWLDETDHVTIQLLDNSHLFQDRKNDYDDFALSELEESAIKQERPKYNVAHNAASRPLQRRLEG